MDDRFFMEKALAMARQALDAGEFPVGCVLTCENEIIASGARLATTTGAVNEMDHAEMTALRRLEDLGRDLDRSRVVAYSTMEPCLMCFAALILRILGTPFIYFLIVHSSHAGNPTERIVRKKLDRPHRHALFFKIKFRREKEWKEDS